MVSISISLVFQADTPLLRRSRVKLIPLAKLCSPCKLEQYVINAEPTTRSLFLNINVWLGTGCPAGDPTFGDIPLSKVSFAEKPTATWSAPAPESNWLACKSAPSRASNLSSRLKIQSNRGTHSYALDGIIPPLESDPQNREEGDA